MIRADAPQREMAVHRAASGGPAMTRRRFLGSALAGGAATISPFAFVRAIAAPARFESFVREQMREAQTPGIAVSLVRGDEIAWTIGAGWADRENDVRVTPDTVFMLASVSKTVTCAGVMSVVEDGDLDLDADVNDYLPFEVRIPAAPEEPITTRMLLIHTSAIRDRFSVWGTPYSRPSTSTATRRSSSATSCVRTSFRARASIGRGKLLRAPPRQGIRILEHRRGARRVRC